MKTIATGESERTIILAEGNKQARLIIAEKTAESLRTIASTIKSFSNDPTQYLIGLQYIKMLQSLGNYGGDIEVYMPLQLDLAGEAGFSS